MGQELRSIVLTEGEFTSAAGIYFDGKKESPIAAGNVASIEGPDEPNGDGRLQLKSPLVDGQAVLALDSYEMIEMIVAFCRHKAIPLPRSGRKTILRRDTNIVLEIELDWF